MEQLELHLFFVKKPDAVVSAVIRLLVLCYSSLPSFLTSRSPMINVITLTHMLGSVS